MPIAATSPRLPPSNDAAKVVVQLSSSTPEQFAGRISFANDAGDSFGPQADDGSSIDDGSGEIMREFAAAMDEAKRRAPRNQVGGILRALKDARRAALATVRRNVADDRHGRRQAAMLWHIRVRPALDR